MKINIAFIMAALMTVRTGCYNVLLLTFLFSVHNLTTPLADCSECD